VRILAVTNMYPTACAPASGTFVEQQIKGLRQIGLEVELLFLNRLQQGMRVYMDLKPLVRTAIERFQPDITHVMYGGVMADLVTRTLSKEPTVVTFHGSDLLGGHFPGPLRRMSARYGVFASHGAARRATGIVAVAKVLEKALPRDIDRSKIAIIPCGIDLDRFRPLNQENCRQRLGWSPNRFHVLFPTNSGNPVKRPALAAAAVAALNRLGIATEIHSLRNMPNDEVPVWLNACDALLLTSLHEGSPTIIKEALACDLPVVSVEVGDVRERIQGIAGCHLALPDPDDLASKLQQVHSGPHRIAGRAAIQSLSIDRIARRLEEFYNGILA
jgi:teichuronic acid biosynthesis glycosyltransferase TuaC